MTFCEASAASRDSIRAEVAEVEAKLGEQSARLRTGVLDGTFLERPAALFQLRIDLADTVTRAVSLETIKTGVTCNAVSPGTLPTPAIARRINALAREEGLSPNEAESRYLSERQPSGRFVELGAVGDLIVFLCGPSGADISGAVLPIDGGWGAA